MYERLENLIDEIMEAGQAAGLAAAAVDARGNTLWQCIKGYRDAENGLPIDEDTIFGLASVSKSFTSIAILQLEERGVLSLDDPVSKHLPFFRGEHHGEPVRVRHLLSHTGGYSPVFRRCIGPAAEKLGIDLNEVDAGLSNEIASAGGREVAAALDSQALIGRPGQHFSYCNDGFGLLSEIIRIKGGCGSFPEYVKQNICVPLGMTRSNAEFLANAADANHSLLYNKRSGVLAGDSDYTNRAFVLGGGGALKSTLSDMKKYVNMLLESGRGVMARASAQKMITPVTEYSPVSWYGCGLYSKRIQSALVWQHGGSLPGVSSAIAFCPSAGIGAVVLCNTEGVAASAACEGIMRAAMGLDPYPVRAEFPACGLSFRDFACAAGRYENDEGDAFDFECAEDGMRILQEGKSRDAEPAGRGILVLRGRFSDTFARFLTDEGGEVYAARFGSRVFLKK